MSGIDPPKSPTLLPPRKSVELEDPGAHDLDSSEEDVFTDARDILSPTVPVTRVEKVDDKPSHGEVPGTAAYALRTQDAVPDEMELVPEGSSSMPSSRRHSRATSSARDSPVPKTVLEKVDDSPSYGEVPGTEAHAKRLADAVPDSIVKAQEEALRSTSRTSGIASPASPIPKTVVTKVDSEPSHGEVPGTDAYSKRVQDAVPDMIEKSPYFERISATHARSAASPIAADGGFGPMDYEEDDESDDTDINTSETNKKEEVIEAEAHDHNEQEEEEEDGFGDDFDDFEEGEEGNDDFGDFDNSFVPDEPEPLPAARQPIAPAVPSLPVLDFSGSKSLTDIVSLTDLHLSTLFPSTIEPSSSTPHPQLDSSSTFLTDRSLSLWSQLVAPPPLQPRNWVRSRIRRLFLVSLGVPVDLDEILPKSKQKKLVLNYTSATDSAGTNAAAAPQGAAARLRNDAENASDSAASIRSGTKAGSKKTSSSSRRNGPPPPPDFDVTAVKILCDTTDEALEGMTLEELRGHVKTLEELVEKGKEVLQYWVKRKEVAVGEKEAFDGVIENLVRHARRVSLRK